MTTVTLPHPHALLPSDDDTSPAAFVVSFGMIPGETEVELARIVALFFKDSPASGLLNVSVIQTADGRIGKRLLFDTTESLRLCVSDCALRRPVILKRAEALADPASVPVMWMGRAHDIPHALWPSAASAASLPDDGDSSAAWPGAGSTRSPSSSSTAADSVVDLDAGQSLRAWPGAEALFKFMTLWDSSATGPDSAPDYTVLLSGLPGRVTGAGYFTRFVHGFTLPSRRLQHAPYLAIPQPRAAEPQQALQITSSYPQTPQPPRRTLCLTAKLETGATVRCKFDTAVVGSVEAIPKIGERVLLRVPMTPCITQQPHAARDDATTPSPLPALRSATVKAASSWSRKRAGDARVPVVERLWSSPDDDVHDRAYVAPLAAFTLAVARNVLRDGGPLALRFDAACAFHDLSGVVIMVGLAQRDTTARRGELEQQLAHVAREVHYRVGVAVHWAPVVCH